MTLISQPGSYQQMAIADLDAGIARDIALMLADVRAVLDGLAAGSPCTLQGLAGAAGETEGRLRRAIDDALAEIPGIP